MHSKKYKILIPKDPDGFTQRECPSCEYVFGISIDPIPNNLFCPYCSHNGHQSTFHTKDQVRYATQEAMSRVNFYIQKQLQAMMTTALQGSKNITFRPGYISKQFIPKPEQGVIPTDISCASCDLGTYKVFGISSICPYCSSPNTKILEVNLEVLESEISTPRDLRYLYGDLVIVFQRECRFYASSTAKANFQNVVSSRNYFLNNFQIDVLKTLTKSEELSLRRVFEKRHAEQHNSGVIDEKYARAVPEEESLIGQRVNYDKQEALSAINALKKISGHLKSLSKNNQWQHSRK